MRACQPLAGLRSGEILLSDPPRRFIGGESGSANLRPAPYRGPRYSGNGSLNDDAGVACGRFAPESASESEPSPRRSKGSAPFKADLRRLGQPQLSPGGVSMPLRVSRRPVRGSHAARRRCGAALEGWSRLCGRVARPEEASQSYRLGTPAAASGSPDSYAVDGSRSTRGRDQDALQGRRD